MEKYFLKSKTIIGILVMAVVALAPQVGLSFSQEDGEFVNATIDTIIQGIAAVFAAYGRFVAKEELKVGIEYDLK